MQYRGSLKKQLLKAPFTFEFAQAAHILYGQAHGDETQKIFFRSTLTLSPSASDIFRVQPMAHIQFGKPTRSPKSASHQTDATFINLHVNFFGIAGSHGPLPLAYTERIFHNLKKHDRVLSDFLDIFNHRLLNIFFRLKQKFYPVLSWSPPEESSSGHILSALTSYQPILKNAFPERALLRLSQVLWKKPHTSEGLARLLSHHFNIPVQITPFIGGWHPIPRNQRTTLRPGGRNVLGNTFMVGQRTWCQDDGILVGMTIPSMDLFLNLLPEGKYYFAVYKLIALYVGPRFHFKVVLSISNAHPFPLGLAKKPFFLGWTSWIGDPKNKKATVVISRPPREDPVYNTQYTSSIM
jgi:type VI secretion system protein ImpH